MDADAFLSQELIGIGPPWWLTDGLARSDAVARWEKAADVVEQALAVLERCAHFAAAHPLLPI